MITELPTKKQSIILHEIMRNGHDTIFKDFLFQGFVSMI